jgi:acetyl-CoA C-acetyltransferase
VRRVAISSWATSKFVKDSKRSLFELACDPCVEILKDVSVSRKDIDAVIFSSCATEQYSSTIVSEMLGMQPKVSHRIDNLCNSGTNAVASAFSLIASGMCDSALVIGAEKADSPGNKLFWDITRGSFMFPVHWAAIFAKAHMRKYGTTEEQMAMVSVKNHKNASKNPKALFDKPVSLKEVMDSKKIVDPVKLLDCSAPCDGASAVLLVSEEEVKKMTDRPVWIRGIGQQTNSASFANATSDLTTIESAKLAARDAFEMARIRPSQIDIAELHDAFTILEILAYEDMCFAKKGEGGKYVGQNEISINPRGGIIGCGHPVGTTGVAQVAEIASQLAGEAGKRQIKNCRNGLVHNLAAAGSSATVIIMGA